MVFSHVPRHVAGSLEPLPALVPLLVAARRLGLATPRRRLLRRNALRSAQSGDGTDAWRMGADGVAGEPWEVDVFK